MLNTFSMQQLSLTLMTNSRTRSDNI